MTKEQQDFLGTGWSFPPTFSQNGHQLEMVAGVEDVQQSLEILLGTRLKERLLHDDYGCDLNEFLFEEMDQSLVGDLKQMVRSAILKYESRIHLHKVEVSTDQAVEGLLLINIQFTLRTTNSRYNMVYPFYIKEATGIHK
jgi:phage baseplate assembly protein W